MRRVFTGLLLLALTAAAAPVFAKRAQDVKVQINKQIKANGLTIEFVELVEDSRCPVDVDCIWAGNAKINVRVSKNGKSKLIELNTMPETVIASYAGYKFKLKGLLPELRSNARVNRNAYVASIEMTKMK